MSVRHLMAAGAPAPAGQYSHATRSGDWLFVAGQSPLDPDDGRAQVREGIEGQTHRVMQNLKAVLDAAGGGFADVVSTRVSLTHFDRDHARMDTVYAQYFPDGLPARSCVGVTGLARGCLVEIELVACLAR